jgi:hypothetical protein
MTAIAQSLISHLARLLAHDEREAVLGDLAETGASAWHSLVEITGLIFRREAALWNHWRPWLAAFGVALPGVLLLQGVSFSISCTYQRLAEAHLCRACAPTGLEDLLLLSCHVLLLSIWSWSSGFVVGAVSRRTLWASVLVALVPCCYCQIKFHETSLSRLCLLLFVPLAVLGARRALRSPRIGPAIPVALASVMTVLMVFAWSNGALWVFNWGLMVPAWYIVIVNTASRVPLSASRAK